MLTLSKIYAVKTKRPRFNNLQIYQKIPDQSVTKKQSLSMHPQEYYEQQLIATRSELSHLQSRRRTLGILRLFFFLAAIIGGWLLLPFVWYYPLPVFITMIWAFFFVVSKDLDNSEAIAHQKRLVAINENELAALRHEYYAFPDGKEWMPATHDYAEDLDILGHASLFQYCNRAKSEPGSALFAQWLLAPASPETVLARQAAVKELAQKTEWRQTLQAHGEAKKLESRTRKNITSWLDEPVLFANHKGWLALRFIFPLISFSLLGLHLFAVIPFSGFLPCILLMLVIAFSVSRMIMPAYMKLNRITAELDTLSASIACIETATFNAPMLAKLQQAYATEGRTASASIRQLRKILDRLDYRLNPVVFIPLSAFLCWDLWQVLALEKWKQKQVNRIPAWFDALAEFEALWSLATLSFNHPDWCFPVLTNQEAVLSANGKGHPLIPGERNVTSDFSTSGKGKLNLITGSNMSGKSTFLRSAGVNIVLAMAGGPVCAKSFTLSPMRVMSSMRISDNLEENTSTFYAELRKLKSIIDSVNRGENVFLLLDEILRGTNSADRHTGSAALIRQLLQHGAAGMLATHDLELARLENDFPGQLINYHFDVQVEGEELFFDYKLKEGVCTSMNASLLMKKIGIQI